MKKIVIGAVILLQSTCSMCMQESRSASCNAITSAVQIPANIMQSGTEQLQAILQEAMHGVSVGEDGFCSALVSIQDNCIAWFGRYMTELQSHINQAYSMQLRDRHGSMTHDMQEMIAQKNSEISELQARLNALLHADSATAESMRIFDQEMQYAENRVRETRQLAERCEESPLFSNIQIERTINRFGEELNTLKRSIEVGQRTLQESLERVQERYRDNINSLISYLDDRYHDNLSNIERQHNERYQLMIEAYENQKSLMQRMINEATALNTKLENARERHSQISRIFMNNPSLKPEKILVTSAVLSGIANIDERRNKISDLHKTFSLFQSLLGRSDLGITATNNDLQMVRDYIDAIAITPFNEKEPLARPVLIGHDNGVHARGGDVEWNWGRRCNGDHHAWVNPHLVGWLHSMDEKNFTVRWWNKYCPPEPGILLNAAIARASATYEKRMADYIELKRQYKEQIERATNAAIPSVALDRLITQFNTFVNEL